MFTVFYILLHIFSSDSEVLSGIAFIYTKKIRFCHFRFSSYTLFVSVPLTITTNEYELKKSKVCAVCVCCSLVVVVVVVVGL